jgi:hypothetical protein
VLLALSNANRRLSGLRSLSSAAWVHCSSSDENKGMCPASGIRVALGEAVEVATVLLGGAEAPCCAAAVRTRDDERSNRESCMVKATTGQRTGEKERNGTVQRYNTFFIQKQQICTVRQFMVLLPTCVAKSPAGVN